MMMMTMMMMTRVLLLEKRRSCYESSWPSLWNPSRSPQNEVVNAFSADADGKILAPRAGSIVALLEQAIQRNSNPELEACLNMTHDEVVIANTVQALPAGRVGPFLKWAVSKFGARPARGGQLIKWIRKVIDTHASFIVSQPDVLQALSDLNATIESRLSVFPKLLALAGRMDLVMGQVTVIQQQRASQQGQIENGDEDEDAEFTVYNDVGAHMEESGVAAEEEGSAVESDPREGQE